MAAGTLDALTHSLTISTYTCIWKMFRHVRTHCYIGISMSCLLNIAVYIDKDVDEDADIDRLKIAQEPFPKKAFLWAQTPYAK